MSNPIAKSIDAAALIADLLRHEPFDAHERAMTEAVVQFLRSTPEPFSSTNQAGHITASAWVVREDGLVLLTHHTKLDAWFQVGGHVEPDDESVFAAARREALEESGLTELRPLSPAIFDVDVHRIPARGPMPAHLHHDIRYLFAAVVDEPLRRGPESRSLEWVAPGRAAELNPSESVQRMVRKSQRLAKGIAP